MNGKVVYSQVEVEMADLPLADMKADDVSTCKEFGRDEEGAGTEKVCGMESEESPLLYSFAALTYIEAVKEGQAKEQEWGFADVLITALLWLLCLLSFGEAFFYLEKNDKEALDRYALLLLVLYFLFTCGALFGYPMFAAAHKGNGLMVDFGLKMTPKGREIVWGFVHSGVFTFLIVYAFKMNIRESFFEIDKQPFPFQYLVYTSEYPRDILMCVWATVALLSKVFFCTGLVFCAVAKSLHIYGRTISGVCACVASAVVFACLQVDREGIWLWLVCGLYWAIVRLHTGSIISVCVCYAIVSLVLFVIYLIADFLFGSIC